MPCARTGCRCLQAVPFPPWLPTALPQAGRDAQERSARVTRQLGDEPSAEASVAGSGRGYASSFRIKVHIVS